MDADKTPRVARRRRQAIETGAPAASSAAPPSTLPSAALARRNVTKSPLRSMTTTRRACSSNASICCGVSSMMRSRGARFYIDGEKMLRTAGSHQCLVDRGAVADWVRTAHEVLRYCRSTITACSHK